MDNDLNYGEYDNKPSSNYVSFGKAIKLYFKNFVNFKGRASKSAYWWARLFRALIASPLVLLCYIPYLNVLVLILSTVVAIGFLLGDISLDVRRLHDIGLHGTYLLKALIPFAGPIIVFVKMFKGSDGDNQWGPRVSA